MLTTGTLKKFVFCLKELKQNVIIYHFGTEQWNSREIVECSKILELNF